MTLSITTFRITKHSIVTLSMKNVNVAKLGIMTLSTATLKTKKLGIMTLGITPLRLMSLDQRNSVTRCSSISIIQHNDSHNKDTEKTDSG
jgi:hypothetical protein